MENEVQATNDNGRQKFYMFLIESLEKPLFKNKSSAISTLYL